MAEAPDFGPIDEDIRKWQVEAQELARVYRGLINVATDEDLGALAFFSNLESAPIDDLAELQRRLQVQDVAGRDVIGGRNSALMARGALGYGAQSIGPYEGNIDDLDYGCIVRGGPETNLPVINGYQVSLAAIEVIALASAPCQRLTIINPSILRGVQANRVKASNAWQPFVTDYSTRNTTVDSNGFLKAASPIFRLANSADPALADALDFMSAGAGAANPEAAGVSATHDDTGVYRIHGSLGFATEGWTINLPQDANGNRLVFVKTEQADDGTITVCTYTRKPNLQTLTFEAGDPVDIPDGRWIDLRLSMPEPEQPDDPTPEPENLDPTTAA